MHEVLLTQAKIVDCFRTLQRPRGLSIRGGAPSRNVGAAAATAAHKQLGDKFDALRFHDAILAHGLLLPDLLRQAVLAELR